MNKENFTMYIITQLILEYRTSLSTISSIFNIEEQELYNKLLEFNKDAFVKKAVVFVLNSETQEYGLIDQKVAKRKALAFLTKLHLIKDKKEKLEFIKTLDNSSYIDKLLFKTGEELTDDEINDIIKYRYKYAMQKKDIYNNSNFSRYFLDFRERKVDEEFKKRLEYLNQYNEFYAKNGKKM